MRQLFVGFDSAWSRNNQGSICGVSFENGKVAEEILPRSVGFKEATALLRITTPRHTYSLLALDQPTIVPNLNGSRPVEKVAASLVSWVGGGVQPANRNKLDLFGEHAPIWQLKNALQFIESPLEAREAQTGNFLVEVFPALSLPATNSEFFGRLLAPKYNPKNRKKFKVADWNAVLQTLTKALNEWKLFSHADFANRLMRLDSPTKADQDHLDAMICLWLALEWKKPRLLSMAILGDLQNGYMLSAISNEVLERLQVAAFKNTVPVTVPRAN